MRVVTNNADPPPRLQHAMNVFFGDQHVHPEFIMDHFMLIATVLLIAT